MNFVSKLGHVAPDRISICIGIVHDLMTGGVFIVPTVSLEHLIIALIVPVADLLDCNHLVTTLAIPFANLWLYDDLPPL
jgi:hypothetical protein